MLDTRAPVLIDEVTVYPGWRSQPETAWIRSNAAAPIVARDQVIGFLNIDSAEPRHFPTS